MRPLRFLLILLVWSISLAANSNLDSIEQTLVHLHDTMKVRNLNKLCYGYVYTHSDKALQFGHQALAISKQINFERGITKSTNLIGIVYDVKANYDSALYYYNLGLQGSRRLNDPKGIGSGYNNLGLTYWNIGKLDHALYYYLRSVKEFEKIDDTLNLANAYSNIGLVYWEINQNKKALYFAQKARTFYMLAKHEYGLGAVYSNLGNIYSDMRKHDSAFICYQRAIAIKEKINDQFGLGKVYSDFAYFLLRDKRLEEGLSYLKLALSIELKNDDLAGAARTATKIGEQYSNKGDFKSALAFFEQAQELSQSINSFKIPLQLYHSLSEAHASQGNFKQAYHYRLLFSKAKDSIFNTESTKQINELQTKYETAQKDLQISAQQSQLKQREMMVLLIGCGLAATIVFGFLYYNRYKLKQKMILDQEIIRQQELRNNAIIEAESKERIRIARELHDGIGQQLSAVKMNISAIEADAAISYEQQQKFKQLIEMVDDAVKEVRTVSHDMMPNALLRHGLVAAIRDFINKISSTGAIRIDLNIVGLNNRLEATKEAVLYRVLQECVSNIVRHAKATVISIQLIKHETHLNMLIEDNGIGFNTKSLNSISGIGLKNIISRVQYMNGSVEFDSSPGKGTTVNVDIPLI